MRKIIAFETENHSVSAYNSQLKYPLIIVSPSRFSVSTSRKRGAEANLSNSKSASALRPSPIKIGAKNQTIFCPQLWPSAEPATREPPSIFTEYKPRV